MNDSLPPHFFSSPHYYFFDRCGGCPIGTYDILYDDGDSEQRVERRLIRVQASASGNDSDFYGEEFSDERSVATKKVDSDEYSVDDFDATRKSGGTCAIH